MGPIALFDKSFLQSLHIDESVWFDHYFYSNICPLFFVETLADLQKPNLPEDRSPEGDVSTIAKKAPQTSGAPCEHHRELFIQNLLGHSIPMTGQIPMAGAQTVRVKGKQETRFDASPEAQAFIRWQNGEFNLIERQYAAGWRKMLTELDLDAAAKSMNILGITPKTCKSPEKAFEIAKSVVHSNEKPFEIMTLCFNFLQVPREYTEPILKRWSIDNYRPLPRYAPYAAYVLIVELFFQIALGAKLISTGRPSNRADIAYLFYLPFCQIFLSTDKLHRKCAPLFLRDDQDFVWGDDLKRELRRIDNHFSNLPAEELEKGIMSFAGTPCGENDDLIIKLWDRHTPGWRRAQSNIKMSDKAQAELVERMRQIKTAPTLESSEIDWEAKDEGNVSIQRNVQKKKGKWYQLPKNLKTDTSQDDSE